MKRYLALTAIFISLAVSASAQPAKTVAILGDSYSTFYGFIPDDQPSWYYHQIEAERSDVNDVRQTWWWKLIKEGGFKLGVNDSYSGATVSYYGYNDEDYTDRSFITRATRLGNPDIILVFGAINDSWTGVRMGEYRYEDITRADLFTYRPALAKLFRHCRITILMWRSISSSVMNFVKNWMSRQLQSASITISHASVLKT